MGIEHKVKSGDSVIGLSELHGLFADTIWDDSANAELKRQRPDMNVLEPGDVVVIPDKQIMQVDCSTDALHRFTRKGIPAKYRLQLFRYEEPRANEQYQLVVDGVIFEGETDDKGVLEEFISPTAREAELIIGPDEFRMWIDFGHLSPLTELSGVQQRLTNLGYVCDDPDGELGESTRAALREFQRRFDLEENGTADEATVTKLEEVHESPNEFPEEQSG